jgi:protein-tyrosine-phosphatase
MRIYYICTGNSFRSPTAEALTRRFQPELEVESAGTHPADHIAENAIEMLGDVYARQFVKPGPDPVSQRAIDEADRIVVMKQEHLDHLLEHYQVDPDRITNWDIDDPIHEGVDPREQFDELLSAVKSL